MPRWRGTTVAGVVLDVADDGAFEDPMEWRDIVDGEHGAVANGEHGTAATVDKLARVHARTLLMESVARPPQ